MHSNVTIKNVSWPHFSWPTLYIAVTRIVHENSLMHYNMSFPNSTVFWRGAKLSPQTLPSPSFKYVKSQTGTPPMNAPPQRNWSWLRLCCGKMSVPAAIERMCIKHDRSRVRSRYVFRPVVMVTRTGPQPSYEHANIGLIYCRRATESQYSHEQAVASRGLWTYPLPPGRFPLS